jgi:hypothetical protein
MQEVVKSAHRWYTASHVREHHCNLLEGQLEEGEKGPME